jgi:hypothetical protein
LAALLLAVPLWWGNKDIPEKVNASNLPFQIEHDFGVVQPRTQLSHCFLVQNPSAETWKLVGITRSCNCSVVEPASKVIAPGQSQSFEFSYRAPGKVGNDRQSVKLHFAGAQEKTVTLKVSAKTRDPMTVSPAQMSFGQVAAGSTELRTLRIENYSAAL